MNSSLRFSILLSVYILVSCGGKSPKEYGKDYCNCMKEYNGNMTKCKDILNNAKSDFDESDEKVKKAFIDAYQNCMHDD